VLQEKRLPVPWLSFAKSLPVYALVVANIASDWGFYVLQTCLPLYFKYVLNLDITTVS